MTRLRTLESLQQQVVKLYGESLNYSQIARAVGINEKTAKEILVRHGVQLRPCRLKGLTIEQKFWMKVVKGETADSCWAWSGRKYGSMGYGQIRYNRPDGKRFHTNAQRISWNIHYGEIPPGLFVCHKCDNPECTNPNHLFLGTRLENSADCRAKKRQAFGERNGRAKLTEAQVSEIKYLYLSGLSQPKIAQQYGVTQGQVSRIVLGKQWTTSPVS